MGVPPWVLEEQWIGWTHRAIVAESAEAWVEEERYRRAPKGNPSGQPGKGRR